LFFKEKPKWDIILNQIDKTSLNKFTGAFFLNYPTNTIPIMHKKGKKVYLEFTLNKDSFAIFSDDWHGEPIYNFKDYHIYDMTTFKLKFSNTGEALIWYDYIDKRARNDRDASLAFKTNNCDKEKLTCTIDMDSDAEEVFLFDR